jgi:hypothetical protein
MKSFRFALSLVAVSVLAASAAANASGVPTLAIRTWVSGVGSDSNACTRTAPCLTWAGAMAKTAVGGEIDALDPGDFGPLGIYHALTIDGGGGQVASMYLNSSALFFVNAGSTDVVTIRNLRIQGAAGSGDSGAYGIIFGGGGTLHIEHCVVAGMGTTGINIAPSTQPAGGSQVFIEDTTVQDTAGSGLNIEGQSRAIVHVTVTNSRFTGNGQYGIVAADYSRVTVQNSQAGGNAQAGFLAQANNGTTILSMIDSVATNNLAGGVIAGGGAGISTVRIANMGVFNNVTGLTTLSNGSIASFGNNNNSGNGTPTGSIAQE